MIIKLLNTSKYFRISIPSVEAIPEIKETVNGMYRCHALDGSIILQNIVSFVRYPSMGGSNRIERKEFPIICEHQKTKDEEITGRKLYIDVVTGKKYWTNSSSNDFDPMAIEVCNSVPRKIVRSKLIELKPDDIKVYKKAEERLEKRIRAGYSKYIDRITNEKYNPGLVKSRKI